MTKIDQFINLDDSARDRAMKVSIVSGLCWFVFAKVLLAISGDAVGYSTLGIVGIVYMARAWSYCHSSSGQRLKTPESVFIPRRLAMACATVGIFILLSVAPAPVIEAEILDRKLRRLTRRPVLSPDDLVAIARNLDNVHENHIAISPKTFRRVRDSVKTMVFVQPSTSDLPKAIDSVARFDEGDPRNLLPPRGIQPNEAQAAFIEGLREYYLTFRSPTIAFYSEAKAAVLAFTKAINLTQNSPLHREALLGRASSYLALHRFEWAMADLKTADELGSTDLARILELETAALLQRGRRDDLALVIKLATLGLSIKPPSFWNLFSAEIEREYRGNMLGKRAEANYRSGEFLAALQDCEATFAFQGPRNYLYRTMVLSLLSLGDATTATRKTVEWVDRIPGPASRDVLRILDDNKSDPRRAIKPIEAAGRAIDDAAGRAIDQLGVPAPTAVAQPAQ